MGRSTLRREGIPPPSSTIRRLIANICQATDDLCDHGVRIISFNSEAGLNFQFRRELLRSWRGTPWESQEKPPSFLLGYDLLLFNDGAS
jgi:hypothetical protein